MLSRFPNPCDVFIAGGGPAGLAAAIAARRHGLSVVLADGAVPPIDKSCGEGLMPDGVEALHQLGITIPEGEAYPFGGVRFMSDGIKAEAAFPRGTAYGIRRTHLHRILLDRAAASGVHMLWQTPVTGLHPEGALAAGELVRARWVVGADGAATRVGRCAGWPPIETVPLVQAIVGLPKDCRPDTTRLERAPEQESALRLSAPLPRRALDRIPGTALGPPLPDLPDARQPRRSLRGSGFVQPALAAGFADSGSADSGPAD